MKEELKTPQDYANEISKVWMWFREVYDEPADAFSAVNLLSQRINGIYKQMPEEFWNDPLFQTLAVKLKRKNGGSAVIGTAQFERKD